MKLIRLYLMLGFMTFSLIANVLGIHGVDVFMSAVACGILIGTILEEPVQ